MAKSRSRNRPLLTKLKKNLTRLLSLVLVDARGLTVAEDTDLRKQLQEKLALITKYTKIQ